MFVRLQARARGFRVRERAPQIRESRAIIGTLLSQWVEAPALAFFDSEPAATRSEASQKYGKAVTSDGGCDV